MLKEHEELRLKIHRLMTDLEEMTPQMTIMTITMIMIGEALMERKMMGL